MRAVMLSVMLVACGGDDTASGPDAPINAARQCTEFNADTHRSYVPGTAQCVFDLSSAPDARLSGQVTRFPFVIAPSDTLNYTGNGRAMGDYVFPATRWTGDEGSPGVAIELNATGQCQWIRCKAIE